MSGVSKDAEPPVALRILVVDDDEVDRLAARHALESSGLAVRISEVDGLRAARSAIAEAVSAGIPFDCVLLDDFLGDGRARTLFEDSELPPVIVLTGSGNERVAVELMRAGASDYMPKDELTPSRIAQGIRHALEQRSSAHALRRANEELEQRVAERTAELARTNRRLEAQIEQRREAEERARHHLEQLAHAGRLSTLGEMAAGIAHELHQPLGAIVNFANGSLRRLEARPDDPKGLAGALGKIRDQAERAGEITRRLRSLVARNEPEVKAVDAGELLREVVDLLDAERRHRQVDLALDLAETPTICVDPIQVQQVVLNLLRNAMDAVGDEGPGRRRIVLRARREGERLEVSVADEGSGCPPEVLDQIFDAFFSTKERGMGMGLAICRSIVEAHGGTLSARPNEPTGLVVAFTLPVLVESPAGEIRGDSA